MGAVRMRVQTPEENMTPVNQLASYDIKSSVFMKILSIIKVF